MRPRWRWYARRGAIALVLLLLAGWLLPSFFSAERYRRRLEAGLQRAVHRPVTFGAISFRLLPRPGFSIENAVVHEDPAFGSEPFARVERIDCDLRWHTLWRAGLDLARLRLSQPSFNFVRNARGEWNVEDLVLKSGMASLWPARTSGSPEPAGDFDVEAAEARINFKVGADKKPFAITELRARLNFDPARGTLRFRLAGSPLRTDLSLPTPGVLELEGLWTPGVDLAGPLDATLRTRGALLYDWVPLVSGHNPEIYGVLDAEIRLTGSIRVIKVEGESRLSQLHRWEQLPPADPMPCSLHLRGQIDRNRGRVLIESVEASFADSHLHVTGTVDRIAATPALDLVVALERSRLEDLLALGYRLAGKAARTFGLSGRVDGLLAIQGSWTERRYGGFLSAREVRLSTPSGTFPASEVAVRIDPRGARLAPVRVTLAPRVELVAEGALERGGGSPRYALTLSTKAVPLRNLIQFGRALNLAALQGLDAAGVSTATFRLAGSAWPLARPVLVGGAELHAAQLLVPGLTEPLNLPQAHLQVNGDQVVVDPLVAVIGTSVFTCRLEHHGERKQPWWFDLRANSLSLDQAALWFDVLGHRRPLPLLERLPGLRSFTARRVAASNLFGVLNAKGRFSAPTVTYRALTLKDFRSSVEVSGRVVRLADATFRAGGARGQGNAQVDMTNAPALVTGDVTLTAVKLPTLSAFLPPALRGARGTVSATGHFETRGLTRQEMSANLQGQAQLKLRNVSLGEFDPLEALARKSGLGSMEPPREEAGFRALVANLQIADRRVVLRNAALELAGARLTLHGVYDFEGGVELAVRADLRRLKRRVLDSEGERNSNLGAVNLRLAGPLNNLTSASETEVSRAGP